MEAAHYDRLSGLDNSFLVYEDAQPSGAMHVASTQIHEAAPMRRADGSLDFELIEEYVVSRLDRIPRYRQRLAWTPVEGHPVWVDDASFNIRYHLRHSRLPRPGSERQLKRMVGRIFSQRLDREKPLWELWAIEGLEGDIRLGSYARDGNYAGPTCQAGGLPRGGRREQHAQRDGQGVHEREERWTDHGCLP